MLCLNDWIRFYKFKIQRSQTRFDVLLGFQYVLNLVGAIKGGEPFKCIKIKASSNKIHNFVMRFQFSAT